MYRKILFSIIYVLRILPWIIVTVPFLLIPNERLSVIWLGALPFTFVMVYGFVFCTVGFFFKRYGISGKIFPNSAFYLKRKIYTETFDYFRRFHLIFHIFSSIPILRRILLRSFGYKGQLEFGLHHKSITKDWSLLDVKSNVITSSNVILAPSINLNDKSIYSENIILEENVYLGPNVPVMAGAKIEKNTSIEENSVVGISSKISSNAKLMKGVIVNHGAEIHEGVILEPHCVVGVRSKVAPNIHVPVGTFIPPETAIDTQGELNEIVENQKSELRVLKDEFLVGLFTDPTGSAESKSGLRNVVGARPMGVVVKKG